jgi:hypothetical protein
MCKDLLGFLPVLHSKLNSTRIICTVISILFLSNCQNNDWQNANEETFENKPSSSIDSSVHEGDSSFSEPSKTSLSLNKGIDVICNKLIKYTVDEFGIKHSEKQTDESKYFRYVYQRKEKRLVVFTGSNFEKEKLYKVYTDVYQEGCKDGSEYRLSNGKVILRYNRDLAGFHDKYPPFYVYYPNGNKSLYYIRERGILIQ